MIPNFTTYEADGIDFLCDPVTFDDSGPTTLIGGTVAVDAINIQTKVKTAGTAVITSATSIRCTFAPWSLPIAKYSVQVRAKPAGFAEQTVMDETWLVKESAAASP